MRPAIIVTPSRPWRGIIVLLVAGFVLSGVIALAVRHDLATQPLAATAIQLGSAATPTLLSVRAGSPNGVVTGNAGDTIWDTSTPGFWQCQGGTTWTAGITGAGTNHDLAAFTGTNTLGNSGESDDGTTFATSRQQLFGGGSQFSAGTTITYNGVTPTSTTYMAIVPNDTHTVYEDIPFIVWGGSSLAYDTTGQPSTYWGIDSEATINHSAGANALTAASYHCSMRLTNASGGDANYCLEGDAGGGAIKIGDGANLGGLTVSSTGALTGTTAAVDFHQASSIELNQSITAPASKLELAGDSSDTPQFSFGVAPVNDGTCLQTKNTNSSQTTTGVDVLLDTTVASGARGGFFWSRAAGGGGGAGGTQTNIGGFINVGSTAGYCGGATAGDGCLFANTGNLDFSTWNNSASRVVAAVTSTGYWLVGDSTHQSIEDPLHAPSVNNGTLSGDSSNLIGNISSVGATSSTLTFGNSGFATSAHCFASGQSTTIGVYVTSESKTAVTFSCVTNTSGSATNCPTFDYFCRGH